MSTGVRQRTKLASGAWVLYTWFYRDVSLLQGTGLQALVASEPHGGTLKSILLAPPPEFLIQQARGVAGEPVRVCQGLVMLLLLLLLASTLGSLL